ncbi:MAG: flagellar biosynthesis protein FlhB [Syntrophobacteraceae bacterium]
MAGAQEKTEKPTGKKLEDARERGSVAKSSELNAVVVLFVGSAALLLSAGLISSNFKEILNDMWSGGFHAGSDAAFDSGLYHRLIIHFFIMVLPTAIGTLIAGIIINLIQTKGFLVSFESIALDFKKINPLSGFKRLFSLRSLLEVIKSILKIIIIGYSIYGVLSSEYGALLDALGKETGLIAETFGRLAFKMVVRVSGIMLVLSILDSYYQHWQHEKDLKMTKQEVKEEHKQTEGNPMIKSRIRSIQRSLARKRMMANVAKATVVITNPTHYAVAILYNSDMEAPKMVAKGVDFLAKGIIKIARKHGVPVLQNPPLARALYKQVKLEDSIPVALYKAVAKVLAYIYQQKRIRNEK